MSDQNDEFPVNDLDESSEREGLSRRAFLAQVGVAGAAVSASGFITHANPSKYEPATAEAVPKIEGAVPLTLRVNGKDLKLNVDPRTTLLDCLREKRFN